MKHCDIQFNIIFSNDAMLFTSGQNNNMQANLYVSTKSKAIWFVDTHCIHRGF